MARLARYWPRQVGPAEPLAAALEDHYRTGRARRVAAHRTDGVCFEIETDEYFTLTGRLAELDRLALEACRGRVLDIGAGAGRHALALQDRGIEVVAVDLSPICAAICRERGVGDARVLDVLEIDDPESLGLFDTIFFGMQTIGVTGDVETLVWLLDRLRTLLRPGGRILADSSELREAWREREAEVAEPVDDRAGAVPGEIVLSTRYRGWRGEPFRWLYLGESLFADVATRAGYTLEILGRIEAGEYLAALTPAAAASST